MVKAKMDKGKARFAVSNDDTTVGNAYKKDFLGRHAIVLAESILDGGHDRTLFSSFCIFWERCDTRRNKGEEKARTNPGEASRKEERFSRSTAARRIDLILSAYPIHKTK